MSQKWNNVFKSLLNEKFFSVITNILALALLGIAKKIFGGENKSHGIFSFS